MTTTSDGLEICYELRGEGPRLLVISGTGADLRNKPSVFDAALQERFTVLAFDQRGLGRTGVAPGPYTMADYADDAAALMDAVGWDSCFVLGVSFGGMVAQELALRHPSRVDKLVLAVTSSGGAGGSSYPLHELQDVARPTFQKLMAIADRRRDATWCEQNPELLDAVYGMYLVYRQARAADPDRERGAVLQLEARRHHDTYERLGALSCPCLVLAGLYDDLAPLANSEALVAAIPGARLEVLPGGHEVLFDGAAGWQLITDFLLR
jgi:3-oxoadipate enol-lactonase